MVRNEVNSLVGYCFKNLRLMNRLTQTEMAHILSTSQARIYGVESGKLDMPPEWMIKLFDVLRANPMYLLGLSKTVYIKDKPAGFKVEDDIPYAYAPIKVVVPKKEELAESE